MIAKHIAMNSVRKSDFRKLVNYITNPQQKNERVGEVWVANCYSDQVEDAIMEVRLAQAENTRASSDKTYHLILSFRAGEQPNSETLKSIESRICEGLGFGAHQRVSAVHYDTDNLHLHVAINKIHPTRHTIHNPYYDHKILGQLCQKLEREYKLEPDNHQARKTASENRVQDMERHSGIESLLGWIKRECLGHVQEAKSWAELHQVFAQNGLEIRERANGLVITNGKVMVKASSVSRDLSKAKLEARLGAFQPGQDLSTTKPQRRYEARPIRTRIDTSELYARYRLEQEHNRREGQSQLAAAHHRKSKALDAAKRAGWLKRSAIKLMVGGGIGKRALYSLAAKGLKREIEKAVGQYNAQRTEIQKRYRREAWADWLRRKAVEGDTVALAALRAREGAQPLKGNTLASQVHSAGAAAHPTTASVDSITKKGTVIYHVGGSAIRDNGAKLALSLGATPACLEAGMRMAMLRYGNRLTVTGSDEFKERVAAVAAKTRLPVTFADGALESRRRSLAAEIRKAAWTIKNPLDVKEQTIVQESIISKLFLKQSRSRGRSR